MRFRLEPAAFAGLAGWAADNHAAALSAFQESARYLLREGGAYRTGSFGLAPADLAPAMTASLGDVEPRSFFEEHFVPCRIRPEEGRGFVTGYYEPEVAVSRKRDARHRFPFYSKPDDLVKVDADNAPDLAESGFAFGHAVRGNVVEYPDRRAIESGFLEGRGLEIAFAADRVDVFFAHIQGAARLMDRDGGATRITYAAKTGHPFTAIGKVLIDLGELTRAEVTMTSLRAWLAANPGRLDEILWQNRSFIFFREASVDDPAAGPIAAAKVPLTAGRSLAVDRLIHSFATPFFLDAPELTHLGDRPFRRLMIAQDTGSAIVGPARGDIFVGSGAEAGEKAGSVRHAADFYVLLPNEAARRML
jgi:membrane-bound lytic murein transglycosylase A